MSARFLGAVFVVATATCFANTITFDDLSVPAAFDSYVVISSGYQGFDWSNFGAFYGPGTPDSGLNAGVVSSPNVAFDFTGGPASLSSDTPFTFTSGYFTAAWNDDLSVLVTGKNGSTIEDTTTIVLSATSPTLFTFNWTGLTEIDFSPSGGTQHLGYMGRGDEFVLDDLTIISAVPEPNSAALLGLGIVVASLVRRRRAGRGTRP